MTEEELSLLKKILESSERGNRLLERIAQRDGYLGQENEKMILEQLQEKGSLRKQEIINLLNVSHSGSLDITKRMGARPDIAYLPGSGKKSSQLIYAKGDDIETKSLQLLKIMQRGTIWNKERVLDELNLEEEKYSKLLQTLRTMFPSEFKFENGSITRFRI